MKNDSWKEGLIWSQDDKKFTFLRPKQEKRKITAHQGCGEECGQSAVGTGLTLTAGDPPGQGDPSPSIQASQSKRNSMEEKHTAHNQQVGLKILRSSKLVFYHTETCDSYHKKLLLEFSELLFWQPTNRLRRNFFPLGFIVMLKMQIQDYTNKSGKN